MGGEDAVPYGPSHDLDLAIVTALGLSAWLAPENGKLFDQ